MNKPKYKSYLIEARREANLSQEKLAQRVGVSRETIRNLEKGTNVPTLFLALSIASTVGWTITKLFIDENE